MQIEKNITKPSLGARGKWIEIFEAVGNGDSIHVKDLMEATAVRSSLTAYNQSRGKSIQSSRRKVGDDDPAGPGYRIWFSGVAE